MASGKKNLDINYNLYKTFWGMQKFLSMDNKAIVSKSHWDDVQLHFATILSAFEQLNYRQVYKRLEHDVLEGVSYVLC